MTQPDISALIDSNIFLQCRDIKDLDWHHLLGITGWVEIVISPVVIRDLDRKKIDRNQRLRTRSRAALAQIEQASTLADERIELKARPRLTLRVAHLPPPDWSQTPTLNPVSDDDMLVAHALGHAKPAVLVSHDTGPRLSARRYGMQAVSPPDDWLLPDQPDEAEQENQKLRREVLELRNTRPAIETSFTIGGTEVKGLHLLVLPVLAPLPEPVISALVERYLMRFPKANLRVPEGPSAMKAVSAFQLGYNGEDIQRYATTYDAFRENVAAYYSGLHNAIASSARQISPRLVLQNTSRNTAERLLITMRVTPGLQLLDSDDKLFNLAPPIPPRPPRMKSLIGSLNADALNVSPFNQLAQLHRRQRDPTSFYWQDRPDDDCRSASLICEEFRAKMRVPVTMDMLIHAKARQLTISVDISASNMPAPIDVKLVLEITCEPMGWRQAIELVTLDEEVAGDIRAVVPV